LVIGYNPSSRFAAEFKTKPWYQVLMDPGIRIGRTDPKLDPKGALTLQLMQKAETFYKSPGLSQRILGAPDNPAQVLPEETLVGRLQSGQLDVGFFYSTETADSKTPAINLPAEIAPKAVYTVTILRDSPNATGADQFVSFLLGDRGREVLKEHGLALQNFEVTGAESAVPKDIRSLLDKAK
jgi:molybdate/tungstate transport system substrate-binding protein